ncbi:MAG: hypothetical protein WBF95_07190 [Comamonas thiooxydans]
MQSFPPDLRCGEDGAAVTQPASLNARGPKATRISIPFMRANRSCGRLAGHALRIQSVAAAQLHVPMTAEPAQVGAPRLLKIVQREPRSQPECLLISGRMADVCAALERMALHEQTAPQV